MKLAPPVRAGLQAQLQQQAVVVGVLMRTDVVLLQHSFISSKQLQQGDLWEHQVYVLETWCSAWAPKVKHARLL